ncbi:MAG: hypothetical protein HFI05_08320 [Lachnospiraceae bacterium]|jgi:hypothetical protein|nr:hypothetical protein [Lachnospiraceae bacterium]
MFGLSGSEMLFYGGIVMMVICAVLAAVCVVLFVVDGRKLKRKLEEEYGKPQR